VLLTREDIDHRTRFLNLRNTIHAVHAYNAVPIINENDTISTDELVRITFGDNDILAALVSQALRADLLVLMTVVDGITDPAGATLRFVRTLADATKLIRSEKSALGKGGMSSKLEAAKIVTSAGESMIVAHGRTDNVLPRLLAGEEIGTFFGPAREKGDRRTGRSRWIGSARPAGTIVVDDGAAAAIAQRNKSLLPAGVIKVGRLRPRRRRTNRNGRRKRNRPRPDQLQRRRRVEISEEEVDRGTAVARAVGL
jgi:glutamate 5-kinase